MSGTTQLDRDAIGSVDPTDQLTDVLALPEHLRDALWKVESANMTPWDSPGGLVVAGMGGSAIGGALANRYGVTAPFWFAFAGSAVILALIWRQLAHIAHADEAAHTA